MLIIQLVLSINQVPNSVEGTDIQSCRVKPAMIPYVMTPSLRQPNDVHQVKNNPFFFFFFNAVLEKFKHHNKRQHRWHINHIN